MIEIEGFVILPIAVHDKHKYGNELLATYYHSFGKTEVEAWRRLIHPSQYETEGDFSIKVQRWHDSGWRPVKAKMEIYNETISVEV